LDPTPLLPFAQLVAATAVLFFGFALMLRGRSGWGWFLLIGFLMILG
jgi:hypothetical protein